VCFYKEFKDSKTASILATQIMPAAICDRVDASGLMARGNSDIEMIKNNRGISMLDRLRMAEVKSRAFYCT
jgi:hypothetical protein